MKQTSAETRIIALEAWLRIFSQPENGVFLLEDDIHETVWGRTRENPAGIFQAVSGNCN